MVEPSVFVDALLANGVDFFTGVPDSLLKDFCACVADRMERPGHVVAANEGGAVALAVGHHLATGRPALVYMQNSGQGNAVNPLLSLADPEVFGIPLVLLVGWRGEPGTDDEPQHVKQGKVTLDLFRAIGVPHAILSDDAAGARACVDHAVRTARASSGPFAIVVRANTFGAYKQRKKNSEVYELNREGALKVVVPALADSTVVVSTTGKMSRELFELREQTGASHRADFRTVGSMGHASQIALGLALGRPECRVCCLDGDGALIMHLGALAIIGVEKPANLTHIIINNGAHDSVGGQPTAGFEIDLAAVARACGYRTTLVARTTTEIQTALETVKQSEGPALLEIRVNVGARADLGRPSATPAANKAELMEYLRA